MRLLRPSNSLWIRRLTRCTVVAVPLPGSIYVTECIDCTFVMGARQVRLHTSTGCDFYLHVASHPIVERCDGLRFAPYPALPAPLAGVVAAAGLDPSRNEWRQVDDYNNLVSSSSESDESSSSSEEEGGEKREGSRPSRGGVPREPRGLRRGAARLVLELLLLLRHLERPARVGAAWDGEPVVLLCTHSGPPDELLFVLEAKYDFSLRDTRTLHFFTKDIIVCMFVWIMSR